MDNDEDEALIGSAQARAILGGIARSTLKALVDGGRLRSVGQVGSGRVFRESDVRAFADTYTRGERVPDTEGNRS